jgi:hypothetical protein
MTVNTMLDIKIIEDPAEIAAGGSPLGKAFMRITSEDGKTTMDITLNLAGMMGGIAEGTAKRLGYAW